MIDLREGLREHSIKVKIIGWGKLFPRATFW